MPTPPNKLFAAAVRGTVAWVEAIGAHPIAFACLLTVATVLTLMNIGMPDGWDRWLNLALLASGCGFLATLALELDLRRSFPVARIRRFFSLALLGTTIGVFWPLPLDSETFAYQALIWGGSLAALLVAVPFRLPYEMTRPASDLLAWYTGQRVVVGVALSLALATLLGAGFTGAFLAVEELLAVDVASEVYAQVWIVALALIWPMSVMVETNQALPENTKLRPPVPEKPARWLSILVGWALIPLSVVYMVILYLYLARLVMIGEMPSGMIAPISAVYLAFGAVTHLAALPLAHAGRPVSSWYRRLFPFTMLLPIAALIWALSVRIDAYGVTEPRFLLGVIAAWLILLALIWMPNQLVAPSRLAGILGALVLVVGGGPWGASAVSLNSQRIQLLDLLRAHDMVVEVELSEEEITEPGVTMRRTAQPAPEDAPPPPDVQARMIDILEFFDSRGYSDYLADLFPDEAEGARAYDRVAALHLDPDLAAAGQRTLALIAEPARVGLAAGGFDMVLPVSLWPPVTDTMDLGDGRKVRVTGQTLALVEETAEAGETTLVALDLAPLVATILESQTDDTPFAVKTLPMAPDRLEATAEADGWRMRLLADRLTVVEQDEARSLTLVEGNLLLDIPE